jgi:hypothetical protein
VLHSAFEFLEEMGEKEILKYQEIIRERENKKRRFEMISHFKKPTEMLEQQTRLGTVDIKLDHFKFAEKREKNPVLLQN